MNTLPLRIAATAFLVFLANLAQAEPLARLEYTVTGRQLQVSPGSLAVPKGIPGSFLATVLAGGEEAAAEGTYIEATLRGPSFPARRIVGQPGQPILLPPLNLVGDYSLDKIRLVDSETNVTILEGTPNSIPIRVFDEVLIARVTSRPLSTDEIQERGIVIDENNFRALEFEVGFVVDGKTIPVKFPVVAPAFYGNTEIIPDAELNERLAQAELINESLTVGLPPELEATGLEIEVKGLNIQFVDPGEGDSLALSIPPIAGLVVIPGKIGFLNQFFSVQVFVENAAPAGSGLSVTDVTAELVLPAGDDRIPGTSYTEPGDDPLRFARVGPDAIIQNILPVARAGADGVFGTADDAPRLQPGQIGQSEFLVEGLREGLHVMDVKLKGMLEGLVAGAVEVEGKAAGSILVRNPNFSLAFSHPRTIRTGEPYTASVTILNTSSSPANQVTVTLPPASISGALLTSSATVSVGDIRPGQTAVADFELIAQRTGSITFSNFTSDDDITGRFRLRMGVDERGVPLSPDSIGYPEYVDELPDDLFAAANRVLGQALSIATAGQLPPSVESISNDGAFVRSRNTDKVLYRLPPRIVQRRIIELAEAGQRLRYGDTLERVLADLLLDWQGGRDFNAGFDQILLVTDAGRQWRETIGNLLARELAGLSATERLADRAPDLAGRGRSWWASASGHPAVEPGFVSDGILSLNLSDLPQSGGYRSADGGLLFLPPQAAGRFEWRADETGATTDLSVLQLEDNGSGTLVTWAGVTLPAGGVAAHDPLEGNQTLRIDADGDGTFEDSVDGAQSVVSELAPELIGAVQDVEVLAGRPRFERCTPTPTDINGKPHNNYGTIVGVLFSKPMNANSVQRPGSYELDDGNGAVTVSIQPGGRVALLNLERGIGLTQQRDPDTGDTSLRQRDLTVAGVADPRGGVLAAASVPVQLTANQGVAIEGRVVRADGSPAYNVPVTLTYHEESGIFCAPSKIRPSQVRTDEDGRFTFDFVMAGPAYSISATDTGGLSDEVIAIILQGSEDDQVTRQKLLELANSPSARGTLLEQFAVGGLPEAIAKAEGLDRALLKDVIEIGSPRIGSETPIALRFRGRATVRGTALAADGVTPVADVAVNLFPDPASREKGRGTLTGSDGRFEFFGVPLGVFSVQAQAPDGTGRALSETLTTAGEEREVEVVLSAASIETTSVSGRVFEADGVTPHAGATVLVGEFPNNSVGNRISNVVAAATTDVNGFFSTDSVTVGSHDLVAISVDGKRRAIRLDAAFTAGNTTVVNLALQARAIVRGRVEFSDGRAVENAIVAGGLALVRTDAGGNFVLDGVPTGRRAISAGLERNEAAGIKFPRLGSARIDVVPGDSNFAVIRFEPKGSITGRVLNQAGEPVPGLNVALPLDTSAFAYTRSDENGVYLFENIGLKEWTVSAPAPAASNSQEIIDNALDTIVGAAAGEETFQADLLGAITDAFAVFTGVNDPLLNGEGLTFNPLSWGFEKVNLTFDGQVANADIIFLPEGTISGTVLNGQDVPIGARVRLTGIGPTRTGNVGFILRGERNSDPATGEFEFPGQALAGPFGLQAASPFFPVVISYNDATNRVNPDASGIILRFPPTRETNGRLVGTVFNPDGTPVGAGVKVRISYDDLENTTLADGTFDTQIGLPAGGYSVTAADGFKDNGDPVGLRGRAYVNVQAGVTNEVSVTLLDLGELDILVTETDGTPVPNANVIVRKVGFPNTTSDLVTGADGRVTASSDIFEGHYSIRASAVFGPTTIRGSAGACVFAGETSQVTVVLQPTGTIRGTFLEDDGITPVPFAQILLDGGIGFAATDANGAFEIIGLPLRSYRLIATEPVSGRIGVANGTLGFEGQVLNLRILVRALGEVRGGVLNSRRDGYVPGALVTMNPSDGLTPARQVTTGPDGRFVFPGTVEGDFSLSAVDPSTGIRGSVSGRLDPGVELLELDVPLQPLGEIVLTVLEPDELTPANATVTLAGQGRNLSADTNAEGEVLFGDLPLGGYAVTAWSLEPGKERSGVRSSLAVSQPGANAPVSLVLLGVGAINGTVFTSDGVTPASNATVRLQSSSGPLGSESRSFVTSGDGGYVFDGVAVGSYQVTATSLALAASTSGGIAADGESDTVDLTLGDNGTVRGRLLRADGVTPVAGLEVGIFFDSQSGLLGVKTDVTAADGGFEMTGVPAGPFDFEALLPTVNGIARVSSAVAGNGEVVDLGDVLLDEDDLRVESVVPSDNALDVSVIDDVLITFSEAVDPASFDAGGMYLCDETRTVPATLSVEDDGSGVMRVVRLDPDVLLNSETVYNLVVLDGDRTGAAGGQAGKGPRDLVGRPLVVPFQSSFTTEDARPPELLSLTPADGSVQNDVRSVVRLSFDEAMDPDGVFIMLNGPGGLVTGNSAFGVNNQVAVFTPDVPLLPNATYSVVASGFRDAAGNVALDQPFNATFNTLDTIGPEIASLQIKGGVAPVANAAVELEVVLAAPEAGARVRMTADFVTIGETTEGDDLDLPFTLPDSGRVTIRAIAIDRFGNEGPFAELVIDVLGNQPPQISVRQILPASGAIPTGSAFQLRAEATDDAGISSFRVATTGGAEIPLQSNADGSAIILSGFVLADAGPGNPVTVVAQATDTSGESTPELSFEFPIADGTPPSVAFVSPDAGAEFSPGAVVPIELLLTDNFGVTAFDVAVTGAFTFNQTITASGEPEQAVSTSIAVPPDLTPDGSAFSVSVTARDAADNSGGASRSFAIPDLTPPVITFTSPANGATRTPPVDSVSNTTSRILGRTFQANFSEDLAPESLTPGGVIMRDSGGVEVSGIVEFVRGTQIDKLIFRPDAPLRFEAAYVVTVTPQVTDVAGNPTAQRTFSFTTSSLRLVSPEADARVVEGQTVSFRAEGANNVGVTLLQFTGPDGQVLGSDTGSISSSVPSYDAEGTIPLLADIINPEFRFGANARYHVNGGGFSPPVPLNPITLDIRPRSEDSDDDGIDNGTEIDNGLDPFIDDASEDPDGDNLTNVEEIALGTDPRNDDTDGDGIPDDVDSDPLVPLGGAAPIAGMARPAGSFLRFDGVDDRVLGTLNSSGLGAAVTVEGWIRTTQAIAVDSAATIVTKWRGNERYAFGVWVDDTGGLRFQAGHHGGPSVFVQGTVPVNDGEWHHFACVRDGNASMRIFIDGLEDAVEENLDLVLDFDLGNSSPLFFGTWNGTLPYEGDMDEIRVWSRTRSQDEIRQDAHRKLTGLEPGLNAYWTFDEGAGENLWDQTIGIGNGFLGNRVAAEFPTWRADEKTFYNPPVLGARQDTSATLALPGVDPDGAPLTASITALPANGQLFQTTDGVTKGSEILPADLPAELTDPQLRLIYEPATGFAGPDPFRYFVSDPSEDSAEADAVVNVQPTNTPPTASADTPVVFQDVVNVFDVVSNDNDPDGDAKRVVTFTQPANGAVILNPDGTLSYTPNSGFTGADAFTYAVADEEAWNRFADYQEGPVNLSFLGNPSPGPYGFPVWELDLVAYADPLTGSAPWYRNNGTRAIWDSNWDGQGTFQLWAGSHRGYPLFFNTAAELNTTRTPSGVPVVRWISPFDEYELDLVGRLVINWRNIVFSTGAEVDVAVALLDASDGTLTDLFVQTVPKPTQNAENEDVDLPIDLRGITVDKGDSLVITHRNQNNVSGSMYLGTQHLWILPANPANTATVTLDVRANARPEIAGVALVTSPALYLPFDGDALDAGPNALDGTLNGDAVFSDTVPEALGSGRSLSLDGTGDHVLVPADPILDGSPFTLAYWVNQDGKVQNGGFERVTSRAGDTFETAIGTGGGVSSYPPWTGAGVTVPANDWSHLTWAHDAGTLRLYVDGVLQSSSARGISPSGTFTIGSRTGGSEGFAGLVDDLAYWNSALPENEIALLSSGRLGGLLNASVIETPEDTEVTIVLAGEDGDDDPLSAVITGLPARGTLYQTADGVTRGAMILGNGGTALQFDGIDDVVFLPGEVLDGRSDLTLQWWMRIDDSAGCLFSAARSGQANSFLICPQAGGEEIELWENGSEIATWDMAPVAGELHSFSLVRNQTAGEVELFVDGVSQGVKTLTLSTLNVASGGFVLAQDQDSVGGGFVVSDAFGGTLDEVRVWDRPLTAAEITAQRLQVLTGNEAGLVALYRFDEGTGMTVSDATANGFDGTFGDGSAGSEPDWVFSEALVGDGIRIPVTDPQRRVIYAPDADFDGLDQFDYVVSDGKVESLPGSIGIDVIPVNDAPLAGDDDGGATVDGVPFVTRNVFLNDVDPESDLFTIATFDATSFGGGSVTDNGNGTFTYAPLPGFTGTDSFTYTLTDGELEGSPATVSIDVIALNTFVWNNGAGGNWNDASNWSPNGVPGSGDKAIIDLGGDYTVTVSTTVTLSVLELAGGPGTQTLRLSGGRLDIVNAANLAAGCVFEQTGGILGGPGLMSIAGEWRWSAGTLGGSGTLRIAAGATGTITGTSTKELLGTRTLENLGALTYDGNGVRYRTGTPTIRNGAGGIFEIVGEADFAEFASNVAYTLENAGVLRKTGAGVTISQARVVNTGTFEVLGGEFLLSNGGVGTLDASVLVSAGATLSTDQGTTTLVDGATLELEGTLRVRGGTFTVAGALQSTPGGAAEVFVSSGRLDVNLPATITVPQIRQTGGTIGGSGLVEAGTSFAWSAGTLGGSGTLRIAAGATGTITGTSTKELLGTRTLENLGALTYDGNGVRYRTGTPTIRNGAGATFEIVGEADFAEFASNVAYTLENAGVLRKTGAGVTISQARVVNTGTFEVLGGEFLLSNTGAGTLDASVLVSAGAILSTDQGTTTLVDGATLELEGTLRVRGGTFTVAGALQSTPGGAAEVFVSSGRLDVNLPATITVPQIRQTGGTIGGSGLVEAGTSFAWSAGTLGGSGTLRIAAGATGTITGTSTKELLGTRTLENLGALTYDGNGVRYRTGTPTIRNGAGATFEIVGEADFAEFASNVAYTLENAGVLRKTGAGVTISQARVVNTGTFEVLGGEFLLSNTGAGTLDASVLVSAGAILSTDQGTTTLVDGATLELEGTLRVRGGTFTVAGALQSTPGGAAEVFVSSGRLDVNLPATITVPQIRQTGGTIGGSGLVEAGTSFAWSAGTLGGSGTLRIAAGATGTITGTSTKELVETRTLENLGVLTYDGNGVRYRTGTPTIRNSAGGIFEIVGEADFAEFAGNVDYLLENLGLLRKTGAGTTSLIGPALRNAGAGIVSIADGVLDVQTSFTQNSVNALVSMTGGTFRKSSTLTIAGGTVAGSGVIEASTVANNGATIRPGSNLGNLHITGNFTQGAGGTLVMEISGDVASEEFDTLSVGGTASLGGTIRIVTGAFTATAGESYDLISYPGGAGGTSFGQLDGLLGQSGIDFTANYLVDRFTLTTAPTPSPSPALAPPEDLTSPDENGFEPWLDETFGPDGHGDDPGLCGDLADPDQDSICNLLEYAFGGHPLVVTSKRVLPKHHLEFMDGELYFCLSYYRRTNVSDLHYLVEASSDAQQWGNGAAHVSETMVVPVSAAFERVTIRQVAPIAPGMDAGYLRVRVERIK